ncbi:hypothetical protein K1X84_13385 [bacterium]|nr:hypothetical protein [bacterium]
MVLLVLFTLAIQNQDADETRLFGEWQWISVSGGLLGVTKTAEETGIRRRIVFSKDHVVSFYTSTASGDSLTFRNTFFTQTEKTFLSSQTMPVLQILGMNKKQIIEWSGRDTLRLRENNPDGRLNCYVRIKNN